MKKQQQQQPFILLRLFFPVFFPVFHSLQKYELINKPAQILNCDETGLSTNPKGSKVICKHRMKNPMTVMPGSGKTIYCFINNIGLWKKLSSIYFIQEKTKNRWLMDLRICCMVYLIMDGWRLYAILQSSY